MHHTFGCGEVLWVLESAWSTRPASRMLFLPIVPSSLCCPVRVSMEQGRIGSMALAFPNEGFYSKDRQAIGWFFMRLREVGELQFLDQCYDLLKVTRPAEGQICRRV